MLCISVLLLNHTCKYQQETKLKTAVLDYLKRYHPGDTETYSMVALNLMMYREIAQQLENKAVQGLDRLKGKPLGKAV